VEFGEKKLGPCEVRKGPVAGIFRKKTEDPKIQVENGRNSEALAHDDPTDTLTAEGPACTFTICQRAKHPDLRMPVNVA